MNLRTGPDDDKRRIDRILRKALPDYPLSLIHRLLRQGKILVNGTRAAPQDKVPAGAVITVPDTRNKGLGAGNREQEAGNEKKPSPLPPAHSPLDIIWQDEDLLILNKPVGIAVHGPNSLDTLVQQYLAELAPEKTSLSFRSGPLHRLDKPTSGAIAFSKSLEGARRFSECMREGKIHKQYLAIVEGCMDKAQTWENQLSRDKTRKKTLAEGAAAIVMPAGMKGPAAALTTVTPLAAPVAPNEKKYTLILARIHTGRTHQIRAQAAAHSHPLLGDVKYGGHKIPGDLSPLPAHCPLDNPFPTFFLHAWKLAIDGKINASAPLPLAFQAAIQTLFGMNADKKALNGDV